MNKYISKSSTKYFTVIISIFALLWLGCDSGGDEKTNPIPIKSEIVKDKSWAFGFANYQNQLRIGEMKIAKTPWIEDEHPLDMSEDTLTINSSFKVRFGEDKLVSFIYAISFLKDSTVVSHLIWNSTTNEVIYSTDKTEL